MLEGARFLEASNWQGRSDERIKLAVMTALHWDLAVPRDRVQVSVFAAGS